MSSDDQSLLPAANRTEVAVAHVRAKATVWCVFWICLTAIIITFIIN